MCFEKLLFTVYSKKKMVISALLLTIHKVDDKQDKKNWQGSSKCHKIQMFICSLYGER